MDKTNSFLSPKYWPTWLGIGLLRLIALLPFKAGLAVGRMIGTILYYLIAKRRRVTEVNAALCFPDLSDEQREHFVKDVFKNNGIGIIETAWSYWGNHKSLGKRTQFIGFEILEEALAKGKGVVLLGAHYSHLDLGGMLFSLYGKPLVSMYRQHNNPLMEKVISQGRARFSTPVERKKLREIVRLLRKNEIVWYGPDQDFGRKGAVFVPFFGQTAATITATSKMVGFNDSPILSLQQRRAEDDSGYIIEIARVDGFPSGDETEDARLMNLAIEEGVRKAPSQYMWVHKRFKTQPDGNQALYEANNC
ncbi:LpxL/LpxP family Kdo(2)-lipid IV(A) lauroyl/palmitoleoyl acyltransferase [Neptuniibacter caesariensis]|uniref:Lipid A biosynthesis acyltransferase n=1 Tax=Neptuniibacter caesariensis TaxID=207954 RepID=A0A7U8CA12_NEPCE|nr:LpxL/LpxP family Kdo(2)-lipid IV(A) lauroyl/palmitoleoyl acyltransferase [Neptuniibacter caesariensis]EAR62855.1 lipid A biosynthesis lauroyl acyltransferase [Oceanospirillum sp. MED92] [Neptuniibacter caesariensis]